jgi:large subunit ribosomal protein L21
LKRRTLEVGWASASEWANHSEKTRNNVSAQSAIFKTGGKQYRVEVGSVVRVEKLNAEAGSTIDFNEVLLVTEGEAVKIGKPVVSGAKVVGQVIGLVRGPKVHGMKFRRRVNLRLKWGHRQTYTSIKVTGIVG